MHTNRSFCQLIDKIHDVSQEMKNDSLLFNNIIKKQLTFLECEYIAHIDY